MLLSEVFSPINLYDILEMYEGRSLKGNVLFEKEWLEEDRGNIIDKCVGDMYVGASKTPQS